MDLNQLLNISDIFAFIMYLERIKVLRGRRYMLWKFGHMKVLLLVTLTASPCPLLQHVYQYYFN